MTTSQRIDSLRLVLNNLFQNNEIDNDEAIRAGAANALCVHLGHALNSTTFHSGIVISILHAISILYQCSNNVREESFLEIGSELLPLIMRAIKTCSRQSPVIDIHKSYKYGSSILLFLSVIDSAKAEMEKRGEILDFAYALLQSTQCDEETVKLEIVAMLKNLSFYTEDYRAKIVRHEDLLIALTRVCNSSSSNVMREGVASVLRNLAMGTNVKVSLGRNPYILNTILALSSDPNVRIRRDAVNATLSLALTAENKSILTTHYDGAFLRLLSSLLRSDVDVVVRRRAARTLRCLSCEDTSDIILSHSQIIKHISKAATQDISSEVREEAAKALSAWAMESTIELASHVALLDAIVRITQGTSSRCIELVASCLAFQASTPINHEVILNNTSIVNSLLSIVSQFHFTPLARESVFEILSSISKSEKLSSKLMTLGFLDHIVAALTSKNEEMFTMRTKNHAADVVYNLSSNADNRAFLARQPGLMVALIQFSTNTPDMTRKTGMKKLMMHLVPEL